VGSKVLTVAKFAEDLNNIEDNNLDFSQIDAKAPPSSVKEYYGLIQ
jgi:hypothetical protein